MLHLSNDRHLIMCFCCQHRNKKLMTHIKHHFIMTLPLVRVSSFTLTIMQPRNIYIAKRYFKIRSVWFFYKITWWHTVFWTCAWLSCFDIVRCLFLERLPLFMSSLWLWDCIIKARAQKNNPRLHCRVHTAYNYYLLSSSHCIFLHISSLLLLLAHQVLSCVLFWP